MPTRIYESAFPVEPALTVKTILYRNPRLVADQVLPFVPSIDGYTYKYWKYNLSAAFETTNPEVSRTGTPTEIDLGTIDTSGETKDMALSFPIPMKDLLGASNVKIENPESYKQTVATILQDRILLWNELRTANLVFNTTSYAPTHQVSFAASPTRQWNDIASSTPLDDILIAKDIPLITPNVMVMGSSVWLHLRKHPHVVKAVHANEGDKGILALKPVEDVLGMKIIIGEQRYLPKTMPNDETAAISMVRLWQNHCSLLYIEPNPTTKGLPTFGWSVRTKTPVAGSEVDPKIGAYGGIRVRVAQSVTQEVVCPYLGYFFQNVVSSTAPVVL